jgi:hypothetical protein
MAKGFRGPGELLEAFGADAITGPPRYAHFHVWKSNPDLRLTFCLQDKIGFAFGSVDSSPALV